MRPSLEVRRLVAVNETALESLTDILIDCVEGGASVSFMSPLPRSRARAFWQNVEQGVAAGERVLLVAHCGAEIVGTVQLVVAQPDNQPHRADVSKLLVHRNARRSGAGAALMRAVEAVARDEGKTLLVLDTASADAERLYQRLGWQLCGRIPGYALWPQGGLASTAVYYKSMVPAVDAGATPA